MWAITACVVRFEEPARSTASAGSVGQSARQAIRVTEEAVARRLRIRQRLAWGFDAFGVRTHIARTRGAEVVTVLADQTSGAGIVEAIRASTIAGDSAL